MHTANGRKEAKACNVVLFEKRVGLSDEGIRSPGGLQRVQSMLNSSEF